MEQYTRERAMEWLNKQWQGQKSCPICQHNNWNISDSLGVALPFVEGGVSVGGSVYPFFLIICGTCGYTLFFNAVVAGLGLPPSNEKEKETTSEQKRN